MDLQTLQKLTYEATGFELGNAMDFDAALRQAHAIEALTIEHIHAGARVHALVAAWRDRHQFKKGDDITVSQLVSLVAAIMEMVGWYEPPTVHVINDPQPEPER